jgi:prephenate dehydrogenase
MRRFERVAVVGLGLMGGSLGLAIRKRRLARRVAGFARKAPVRRRALAMGAVDEACIDLNDAVRDADLVVFCAPILAIPRLVASCAPALRPGAVITDVGSTKRFVLAAMERALGRRDVAAVGSHPIAGSEAAGIGAARPDLYRGNVVVVTASRHTPERATRAVESFWRALGARVVTMDPAEHDAVLAATSHGPHLAAAAIAESVLGRGGLVPACFCGTGFRDTTRIAAGSEDVWHDIAATNREAIARELLPVETRLRRMRTDLGKGRLAAVKRFLARARRLRAGIEGRRRATRRACG